MSFTGKATYDAGDCLPALVDDVSDLVRLIAPFDTPLLDTIGNPRYGAKSTRHEWEGGENFTQIFTEAVTVSGSMDAVGLHAVEREFDYQVIQRLREQMRSLEHMVICGAGTWYIEPERDIATDPQAGDEFMSGSFKCRVRFVHDGVVVYQYDDGYLNAVPLAKWTEFWADKVFSRAKCTTKKS